MASPEARGRVESLQMLRFVAAAMVLATHITFYIHERVDSGVAVWHGGESGVSIFFVISGIVMYLSGVPLPRNVTGAKYFLGRRIARVMPLYWLVTTLKVVVALVAPAVVLHNHPDLPRILASYLLLPMLNAEGDVSPIHAVGWTLLHEMFFYYVFALSLLLRQSPFVCSSFIIVGLWLVGLLVPAESAVARVYLSDINLLFVFGMALASLYERGFRLAPGVALLLFCAGAATMAVPQAKALRFAWFGSFDIGAILVVGALLPMQITALPGVRKAMAALGDSSYSLYLLHPILAPGISILMFGLFGQAVALIVLMTFLICVAMAHFIYRHVENPLNLRTWTVLEKSFALRALDRKDVKC